MNNNHYVRPTNRVAEMILGILGSVFGILGGLFAIMLGGIGSEFGDADSASIGGLGAAVILTCIINKQRIVMGILLIIGGILNMIFIGFFGILSGILILVAGILALVRK